jgi:hypothetical protein
MPEKAEALSVTHTGQPQVAVVQPATEIEYASAAAVAPSGTQTATIAPAVE